MPVGGFNAPPKPAWPRPCRIETLGTLQHNAFMDDPYAYAIISPADRRLLAAATDGDTDQATRLLTCGGNPLCFDEVGRTSLMLAALNGHLACVNLFIPYGGVNLLSRGTSALLFAAAAGSQSCARALIKAGADPQQADELRGITPLMAAAASGHLPCVKYLLPLSRTDAHSFDGRSAQSWTSKGPQRFKILRFIDAEASRREALILSEVTPPTRRRVQARRV